MIDQDAAGVVACTCEAFIKLDLSEGPEAEAERARGAIVEAMARLADEFGLIEQASSLRRAVKEFDGRHIEGGQS